MDSLAIFAIVYDYGLILVISQKITPSFSAAGSLVETIVFCTSLCCYWIGEPPAAAASKEDGYQPREEVLRRPSERKGSKKDSSKENKV